MSHGERWKSAREAAGFSVQEAADAVGLHRNTIYKLEKGDDDVTLRLMLRVAAGYGINLGAIFDEGERRERVPVEFRPLLEPLMPMTQQQRENIIRNIAASLSFMGSIYGGVPQVTTLNDGITYTPPPSSNTRRNDKLRDVPVYGAEGESSGIPHAPTTHQRAAKRKKEGNHPR